MKRSTHFLLGIALFSFVIALPVAHAKDKPAASAPATKAASKNQADQTKAPATQEPTPVFTFADDAQIQQFAQLWQQRQATLTKLAVLRTYETQEDSALKQLNDQLTSQFHVDTMKSYALDTKRKVLVERPQPEQPVAPATPAATSPVKP